MEWFYQFGLKWCGLVEPEVVGMTLHATNKRTIEVEVTDKVDEDSLTVNPLLDIRTHPGISKELYGRCYAQHNGMPSIFVSNETENEVIDAEILSRKFKQITTQYYSLVINPYTGEMYYKDEHIQRWAVSQFPGNINILGYCPPVQVGNAIYQKDVDGVPYLTLDGKVWTKCRRVTETRLKWLLSNVDLTKLYEEVVPGGKAQTKHIARTSKRRGTRSR